MKRTFTLFFLLCLLLCGCANQESFAPVAATTLPVYDFTSRICQGTPITVTRLVTEEVSCLHDYSLNVRQVKAAEAAELIVISGAGLEVFLEDLLPGAEVVDSSEGIQLICPEKDHMHHNQDEAHEHEGHSHDQDPHIWLDPGNAALMARNICLGLSQKYPQYEDIFSENLKELEDELSVLSRYGADMLADLSSREMITFHDGFAYFAEAFGLKILDAVEEESGSEASAAELIHLIEEVEHHNLQAVFTEKSGSVSAASIIARETGCGLYDLDMAMAGDSYFEAMYHNIDTIKEAMG